MDVTKLKRNASHVHNALKKLPDGSVIALKPCSIHIPSRYTDANLATIGSVVSFVSVYGIVVDGYYGVSTTNALVRSKPSETKTEKINDVEYLIFMYEKGDVVFTDSEVVSIDKVVYFVWTEIIDKGKGSWFLDTEDVAGILLTAGTHGGANLGGNYSIIEMINSVRLRDPKNRRKHWRYSLNAGTNGSPVQIGLRNIQFTAETDLAKIGGSYPEIGLASSIVNPSEKAEGLEEILLL